LSEDGSNLKDSKDKKLKHGVRSEWSALLVVYTLLMALLQPLLVLYLIKRARKQPEYLQGWSQRFFANVPKGSPAARRIWIHAVSVGETHAISPLVRQWSLENPDTVWVFSSTTPTGQATARQLFADMPGAQFFYLPYDLPCLMRRCIKRIQAKQLWLVETELWPHMIRLAPSLNLKVSLLNARVSPRTGKRLQQFRSLSEPALANIHNVVCQTPEDAWVFEALGRPVDGVTGNLKFDVALKPEKAQLGLNWKLKMRVQSSAECVVLFASSREGEEVLFLKALRQSDFFKNRPKTSVWIVPRHPQRCEEVYLAMCQTAEDLDLADPLRRSTWGGANASFPDLNVGAMANLGTDLSVSSDTEGEFPSLVLGDSMGEMPAYYTVADVAFLGGSWMPLGGQNLIEACAYGCPVWMGPHTFNFDKAAEDALAVGAAKRFQNLDAALKALMELPEKGSTAFGADKQNALIYAKTHQGATSKTIEVLAARQAASSRN
jgi:3-deoxy-D-manno-octulosonic-acid transferase